MCDPKPCDGRSVRMHHRVRADRGHGGSGADGQHAGRSQELERAAGRGLGRLGDVVRIGGGVR